MCTTSSRGGRARLLSGFTLLELVACITILAAVASLIVVLTDDTTRYAESALAQTTLNTVRNAFIGSTTAGGLVSDLKRIPGFQPANLRVHHLMDRGIHPEYSLQAGRGWRGPYVRNQDGVANMNPARQGRFPAPDERRSTDDTTFAERGFFTAAYGETDDRAIGDPWGNPIILQIPPADQFSNPVTDAMRFHYARLVSAGPDGELATPLGPLAGMDEFGNTSLRGDDLVLFLNRSDVHEPGL